MSPRFPADLGAALQDAATQGVEVRFQAIAPDPSYSRPGHATLLDLRRAAAPFQGFSRRAYVVPTARLGDLATALLNADTPPDEFEHYREPCDVRDLLVCTHGTRDACCAQFGFPLYQTLRREIGTQRSGATRVWRCNHLGGHRFAPTILDLPEGRCWGHLDAQAVARLLRHDGDIPDLTLHYRGWTALHTPAEMLVERAIFQERGWAWTEMEIAAQTLPFADGSAAVTIEYQSPDGRERGVYSAVVEPTDRLVYSRSSCDKDAPRETRVHRVSNLVRTPAPLAASI